MKSARCLVPSVLLLFFLNGCAWFQGEPPTAEEVAFHSLRSIQENVDIAAKAYAHYAELAQIPMEDRKPIDERHAKYQLAMQAAIRVVRQYRAEPQAPGALEAATRLAQAAANELIFQIYQHIE